jgi:hypothetical protein
MLIWPEASSAQNNMAAVSADGRTVCVLILRLNSSWSRSIAFVVRALRPAQIPGNMSEFFTNDYETFVRVVRSSCVDRATKNQPRSGLTDRQINTYCECVADNLLNQLTVAELKTSLYARTGQTASMQDKASKAGLQCQRSTLKG